MSEPTTYIVTTREVVVRTREVEAHSKLEASNIVRRGLASPPIMEELCVERIAVVRAEGGDDA